MNFRKYLLFLLISTMFVTMSISMTSCSDDDSNSGENAKMLPLEIASMDKNEPLKIRMQYDDANRLFEVSEYSGVNLPVKRYIAIGYKGNNEVNGFVENSANFPKGTGFSCIYSHDTIFIESDSFLDPKIRDTLVVNQNKIELIGKKKIIDLDSNGNPIKYTFKNESGTYSKSYTYENSKGMGSHVNTPLWVLEYLDMKYLALGLKVNPLKEEYKEFDLLGELRNSGTIDFSYDFKDKRYPIFCTITDKASGKKTTTEITYNKAVD